MVEIECPHCDEGIELDDDAFGLFECPFCEEEFEWESENAPVHEEVVGAPEFWIGSLVPFGTTCIGLLLSYMAVGDSWDLILWGLISILLWPVVAIGIGIYGFMTMQRPLWIGAVTSLAISATLLFLFLLTLMIS